VFNVAHDFERLYCNAHLYFIKYLRETLVLFRSLGAGVSGNLDVRQWGRGLTELFHPERRCQIFFGTYVRYCRIGTLMFAETCTLDDFPKASHQGNRTSIAATTCSAGHDGGLD